MGSVTSPVPVRFRGEGAGSGPLTWAQQGIWQTMQRTGRTMNIGGIMPLPDGATVEEVAGLLGFVIGRHQSLRTRLRLDPGAPLQQIVSDAGETALDIVDVEPDADADAAAEALRSTYEFTPFDHPTEWPIRMGVIRRDGAVTHAVVQYSHLAVDGFGIEALIRDLAHYDRGSGTATAPMAGLTPLEVAAKQQSPAGLRHTEKALQYWEQAVRTIPAQRLGHSDDPREPRFWDVIHRSPAMHLAMQSIAHRTRAGVGYVFLAAYAVALARQTGRNPIVAQVLVSNRFRPGFAEAVAHLTQSSICVFDVADSTFDEVVGRAWKAATQAYMFGYYDPVAQTELLARVTKERGEFDISCFVNDRHSQHHQQPDTPPTPEQLAAALPLTTSWVERRLDTFDGTLYVTIDPAPAAVDLSICADTQRLGPAEIGALALQMQNVTVEAAFDGTVPTRVHAAAMV